MAVLAVKDDCLPELNAFVKREACSREDIVERTVGVYPREKELMGRSEWGRKMAEQGFTEDEVMEIINEEIHLMRVEQGNRIRCK